MCKKPKSGLRNKNPCCNRQLNPLYYELPLHDVEARPVSILPSDNTVKTRYSPARRMQRLGQEIIRRTRIEYEQSLTKIMIEITNRGPDQSTERNSPLVSK